MLALKLKLLEEDLKMWNRGCLVIGNMMYRISRVLEGIKEFDDAEAEAIHGRRVGWWKEQQNALHKYYTNSWKFMHKNLRNNTTTS